MVPMNMRILCSVIGILAFGAMQDEPVPAVDHHQHLYNPALGALTLGEPVTSDDLIKLLDQAGIRRAALFSIAYRFGNPNQPAIANEYDKVQAENDRFSREVARYPDRLRGFCASNPLKDYALAEIARCAKDAQMRFGLKLHFGNSDVQLDDPRHVARLREVFRAANDARMAIVMHVRSTISQRVRTAPRRRTRSLPRYCRPRPTCPSRSRIWQAEAAMRIH